MIKTSEQIEEDVYRIIRNQFSGFISGDVYRKDMRPFNSHSEDVVVSFLAGRNGQTQEGIVVLGVYVPNVPFGSDSRLIPHKQRIGEIENRVNDMLEGDMARDSEYWFKAEETPYYKVLDDIQQAYIAVRITYKRTTL